MSDQNPYGDQPSQDPYGQNQGQSSPYGQQPGQPNPYGQAPDQYGQPAYGQPAPKHGSATTSMVLGLIGLIGGFVCCGVTLVLSPFAWFTGSKAIKEIDASRGALSGRDGAMVGKVTGIIGTVLLILSIVAVTLFTVVVLSDPTLWDELSSELDSETTTSF